MQVPSVLRESGLAHLHTGGTQSLSIHMYLRQAAELEPVQLIPSQAEEVSFMNAENIVCDTFYC